MQLNELAAQYRTTGNALRARAAMEALDALRSGGAVDGQRMLPVQLIVRDSSAPPG